MNRNQGRTILGGARRPGRPDSTIASSPPVATTQGTAENRSEYSTLFTKVGTSQIYDGSRIWAKITLELETAGPCAVGTKKDIAPVLSGKGMLIDSGRPQEFIISKGTRLFLA